MKVEQESNVFVDSIMSDIQTKFIGDHSRTDSIHLTDCIYCLRKAYWDKMSPLPPTPKESLYFILGLGLQNVLLPSYSTPLPRTRAGVVYSPDAISSDGFPVELKTTRMTKKRLLEQGFPTGWLKQMMGYCSVLDKLKCCLLVIPIIQPEVLSFTLSFSYYELQDNDLMIEKNALTLVHSIWNGIVPPKDSDQEWECVNCRYSLRCAAEEANPTPAPWLRKPESQETFAAYKLVKGNNREPGLYKEKK